MVSPDYEAIVTDRFKDDLTAEVIWRLENAGQSSAERLIRSYETALPQKGDAAQAFEYGL